MNKILRFTLHVVLLVTLLTAIVSAEEVVAPEVEAEAYLLMEMSSGKVFCARNADEILYPASTTKILTALLALEIASLDELVTVGDEIGHVGPQSSLARLQRGDMLTVEQLLYALMLPSGNDAAHVLAVYLARREHGAHLDIVAALDVFSGMMNRRAAQLGAINSNFVTPDGYHHPDHYSTASDLAVIATAAWEHDILRRVASAPRYVWEGEDRELSWFNTNLALHPSLQEHYDPRVTGFKTGYTPQAGSCLVAIAQQGETELLLIILNSSREHRYEDSRRLLDYGFNNHAYRSVLTPGRVLISMPVSGQAPGEAEAIKIRSGEYYGDYFRNDQVLQFRYVWDTNLMVMEGEDAVFLAPLTEGQRVGLVQVMLEGQVLTEMDVYTASGVEAARPLPEPLIPAVMAAIILAMAAGLLACCSFLRKAKGNQADRKL